MNKFQIKVDTREQKGYNIKGSVSSKLDTGDYSIVGLENVFAIERKSLSDAWKSFTTDHERFKRELERAKNFKVFDILIEASPEEFMTPYYSGREIHPNCLKGMINKWRKYYGVNFVFCKSRARGKKYVEDRLKSLYEEYILGLWEE
jgi:ERCC4-type nuclease